MALKDSFKKLDLSKATDIVSSVTNTISQTVDKFKTSDSKTEEGEHTIDSVDSLNCYLQSLQADASPAVMMALQSQLQVLKYVQSPSMMLMAVDNISGNKCCNAGTAGKGVHLSVIKDEVQSASCCNHHNSIIHIYARRRV